MPDFIPWLFPFSNKHKRLEPVTLPAPQPNELLPFTTQRHMLKNQASSADGLCAQLSNAFVRARLNGEEPNFLFSEKATYEKALEEAAIQGNLLQHQESDLRHSAFISTNTPHQDTHFNHEEMTNPEAFKQKLGRSRLALFSKPSANPRRTHMVAFEQQLDEGQCRLFDPNLPGGQYRGPCETMFEVFTRLNAADIPEDDSQETSVGIVL